MLAAPLQSSPEPPVSIQVPAAPASALGFHSGRAPLRPQEPLQPLSVGARARKGLGAGRIQRPHMQAPIFPQGRWRRARLECHDGRFPGASSSAPRSLRAPGLSVRTRCLRAPHLHGISHSRRHPCPCGHPSPAGTPLPPLVPRCVMAPVVCHPPAITTGIVLKPGSCSCPG